MLQKALLAAYLNSAYRVFEPAFDIRIGEACAPLQSLLMRHGVSEWAYITACNPRSVLLAPEENRRRQAMLAERLKAYACYPGEGAGEGWPPEASLLVLGITLPEALAVAREFEQLAFVAGRAGGHAALHFTGVFPELPS